MAFLNFKRLNDLIADNKIEEVLIFLKKKDIENDVVISLLAQINNLNNESAQGILSTEDRMIGRNRVRINIQTLLQKLKEEQPPETISDENGNLEPQNKNTKTSMEDALHSSDQVLTPANVVRQLVVNEIKGFTNQLSANTDAQELGKFLYNLAQTLKLSNRRNIQPEFLPATEGFLLKLQSIAFNPRAKFSNRFIKLLIDILSNVQELSIYIESEEKLKGSFFSGMIRLGLSIEKLSGYIKVITPLVMASKLHLLN